MCWQVIEPALLTAWLMEMNTGGEDAPRGGLLRQGKGSPARLSSTKTQLCGDPSKWKSTTGAHAEEPYSMQAYDKRVYGACPCKWA